jgi:3-oxoacyl-[acyl-carrier protein] reductase
MIAGVNNELMPFGGGFVYALTKAAIVKLTRGLARDLAPRGILLNDIQSGPVGTDWHPAEGVFSETLKERITLPRDGYVDEIAGLVSYLASTEAD